jgi:putative hydrolase of the HAD superfamily
MIQAVIFDCFGVLTTEGWLAFKEQHFAHDPQLLQDVTDLNKQSDAGMISEQTFIAAVAELAQVTEADVLQTIYTTAPNEPLFAYIKQLKSQYKIGLLSNVAADHLGQIFTPEHLALFDAKALSYDIGYSKPDARAYQTIARRLGVEPEACVFIDDVEGHVVGARDAGMQAIVYKDFAQTKANLELVLGR